MSIYMYIYIFFFYKDIFFDFQYHYFCETENILVDHIGILDRVDLTLNILNKDSNVKLNLPHVNKNNSSPKIKLSKRHKEVIERVYARDFEI